MYALDIHVLKIFEVNLGSVVFEKFYDFKNTISRNFKFKVLGTISRNNNNFVIIFCTCIINVLRCKSICCIVFPEKNFGVQHVLSGA